MVVNKSYSMTTMVTLYTTYYSRHTFGPNEDATLKLMGSSNTRERKQLPTIWGRRNVKTVISQMCGWRFWPKSDSRTVERAVSHIGTSRTHNIHKKQEKNHREKPLVDAPPRVFHSNFSLVFVNIYGSASLCVIQSVMKCCRVFLKCSTSRWADTAATVQPNW